MDIVPPQQMTLIQAASNNNSNRNERFERQEKVAKKGLNSAQNFAFSGD